MNCHCGKPFVTHGGEYMTLMGYYSPPGHDHDDNRRRRTYICEEGHRTGFSARNRCPVDGCGWVGHNHEVEDWPELGKFSV